jgi:hypothetical protein
LISFVHDEDGTVIGEYFADRSADAYIRVFPKKPRDFRADVGIRAPTPSIATLAAAIWIVVFVERVRHRCRRRRGAFLASRWAVGKPPFLAKGGRDAASPHHLRMTASQSFWSGAVSV